MISISIRLFLGRYLTGAVRISTSHTRSVLIAALIFLGGCAEQAREVGKRVRELQVKTVVDQGLTLDQGAEPAAVVYVLLRAIYDDYAAGDDMAAREAAFDRQLALCAPDHMYSRALRKNLGRNDSVQRIVWHWAPILGHYREDFPKDWGSAQKRLFTGRTVSSKGPEGLIENTRLVLELADPGGDANASVVAQFQLVREKGYWRIAQVGYVKGIRHLTEAHLKKLGAWKKSIPG